MDGNKVGKDTIPRDGYLPPLLFVDYPAPRFFVA
jgi:hypothetical protein